MQLYGHEMSGNSYKVRLLLSFLKLESEWISVDLLKGAHKSAEFRALNSFGQVPVLVDGEVTLADAQAILVYLARQYGGNQDSGNQDNGNQWLPLDAVSLSRVIRWLSITASEVRQGPESARLYHLFKASSIGLDQAMQKSEFILTQLNQHLSKRDWLELGHPTIADVAVFPYVALAPDGKIRLEAYPHVLAWINRVKQLPGFIGMSGIEAFIAA